MGFLTEPVKREVYLGELLFSVNPAFDTVLEASTGTADCWGQPAPLVRLGLGAEKRAAKADLPGMRKRQAAAGCTPENACTGL